MQHLQLLLAPWQVLKPNFSLYTWQWICRSALSSPRGHRLNEEEREQQGTVTSQQRDKTGKRDLDRRVPFSSASWLYQTCRSVLAAWETAHGYCEWLSIILLLASRTTAIFYQPACPRGGGGRFQSFWKKRKLQVQFLSGFSKSYINISS